LLSGNGVFSQETADARKPMLVAAVFSLALWIVWRLVARQRRGRD
jgi:hypothetical protein